MIPLIQLAWESERWQQHLQSAFRTTADLLDYLGTNIDGDWEPDGFPILVPRSFAERMIPGDPLDPLLRQVVGHVDETIKTPGFTHDPLAEQTAATGDSTALLQKYAHRALLVATSGCAVNCRYCFRRHFPYHNHRDKHFADTLSQIGADTSLEEIILSGGDPLILPDPQLGSLLESLDAIQHIQRIRIHTRLPIVLPQRVTQELVKIFESLQAKLTVVLHVNHANELDGQTASGIAAMRSAGGWILNQSVLLRGVNDNGPTQVALSKRLFEQDVLPYYLHLPDRVQGTAHFSVAEHEADTIFQYMQAHLPGYLVPRLVREVPDQPNKVLFADLDTVEQNSRVNHE
ncbi:MAG: EF-P beta-lysylation protein EpmB [Pseudomonadota bacterium]